MDIELAGGRVAQVDEEDYFWLAQWSWFVSATRHGPGYAARGGTTARRRWLLYMHREIAQRAGLIDAGSDLQVDHRDLDHFNNRRSNLRAADRSLNAANRSGRSLSGRLGVSPHRGRRGQIDGWNAEVSRHGIRRRRKFLSIEAAEAWVREQRAALYPEGIDA